MVQMKSHSVWDQTGFLIQATNKPGLFTFADLNPETSFKRHLTRGERFKIGVWFLWQSLYA